MDGTGDEFLAGSGFAEDEDSGAGGGGEFDLSEGAAQGSAIADDLLEIEFRANFLLEVQLFDGELVLEGVNFLESQGVFQRDGYLRCHLLEEFHVGSRKSLRIAAGKIDGAKGATLRGERNAANDLHALLAKELNNLRVEAVDFRPRAMSTWPPEMAWPAGESSMAMVNSGFRMRGLRRQIESMNLEEAGSGIQQGETGVIVLKGGLERRDDAAEESGHISSADEEIVDGKEGLEAVAFACKLPLIGLGGFKIDGVVHGNGDLSGDALHEGISTSVMACGT